MPQYPSGLSKFAYTSPEEGALHHGHIVGTRPSDGLPVRGSPGRAPDMIGDQAETLPVVSDYYGRMFCMWEPEDVTAYISVMDHVANEQYVIMDRVKLVVPEDPSNKPGGHLKIWLEWKQFYAQAESPKVHLAGGY